MRHGKSGRKFNRTSSHRDAMLRNMACSLIKHEQINTHPAQGQGTAARGRAVDHARQDRQPRQPPPGVFAPARPRDGGQTVRRPRRALQGASGRLPSHSEDRIPSGRRRADGAGAARRARRAGVRRSPRSEEGKKTKAKKAAPKKTKGAKSTTKAARRPKARGRSARPRRNSIFRAIKKAGQCPAF